MDTNRQPIDKYYHAFISYSHADKVYASVIQKSIETIGLPFYRKWKPRVAIFRDERKIPLSGSLSDEIVTGLANANHLIVIASKNSANSRWVREEILNWHKLNKDGDGYIINFNFILIDEVVEWDYNNRDFDKLKTTALPLFDEKIFRDIPHWANLRPYCKNQKVQTANANFEWEIAKISGLLLRKKPDEIIDDASKSRRWFRLTTSAIIALLFALTIFAFFQRNNAIKQSERVQLIANEANRQRDIARRQTTIAIENEKEALRQKDSAIRQKKIAQSQALANVANYYSEKDPTSALSFAIRALELDSNNIAAKISLLKAYNTNSWFYSKKWTGEFDGALSKSGTNIALTNGKRIRVVDVDRNTERIYSIKAENVDFLPNNNLIAWTGWDGAGSLGSFYLIAASGKIIASHKLEFLKVTIGTDGSILIPSFKKFYRINPVTGSLDSTELPNNFADLAINCAVNSEVAIMSSRFPTTLWVFRQKGYPEEIQIPPGYYIEDIQLKGTQVAFYMLGNLNGVEDCVGFLNLSNIQNNNYKIFTLKDIDEFDHSGKVLFLNDTLVLASATSGWSKVFSLTSDFGYEINHKRTADKILMLPKNKEFMMAQRSGEVITRNLAGNIAGELLGNDASDGGNPSFYKILASSNENSILTVNRDGIRFWHRRTYNLKQHTQDYAIQSEFKRYFTAIDNDILPSQSAVVVSHGTNTLPINSLGQIGLSFSLNGHEAVFQTELMKNEEDVIMHGRIEDYGYRLVTNDAHRYFVLDPKLVRSLVEQGMKSGNIWTADEYFIKKWTSPQQ